jgi:class II lanthipeptide synthase
MTEGAYLEAAQQLGLQIAAAAIWSGSRCSWVGGMPEEADNGRIAMTYRAFTPDLYGGTAGVGFALAEIFDAGGAGEPELRRTALGAIEHALSRVDELAGETRLGGYSGQPGVALCAARVGAVLGEPGLSGRAGEILAALGYRAEPLENDLLGGRAGGILALLALRRLGVEADLDRALTLGVDLLASAERGEGGWSWPSPTAPGQRNLTGLSHGAAGIGLALLELHHASGEPEFRHAAEAAFDYERSLLDAEAGNWPDFRERRLGARRDAETSPSEVLWCHGAPGIALSRLRACELGGRNGREQEARLALETTEAAVQIQQDHGNYSLCHGLAGNAEVLVEGAAHLQADPLAHAHAVAETGIERHLEGDEPWPLGVFDGHSDSLMVGLAGTAYFYLRLHDPTRPSVLLLRPESFARGNNPVG